MAMPVRFGLIALEGSPHGVRIVDFSGDVAVVARIAEEYLGASQFCVTKLQSEALVHVCDYNYVGTLDFCIECLS